MDNNVIVINDDDDDYLSTEIGEERIAEILLSTGFDQRIYATKRAKVNGVHRALEQLNVVCWPHREVIRAIASRFLPSQRKNKIIPFPKTRIEAQALFAMARLTLGLPAQARLRRALLRLWMKQ